MKPATLPYTPHRLSRWTWIVWVFMMCYLIPIGVTWVYRWILQEPMPVGLSEAIIWFMWCQPLVFAYDPLNIKKLNYRSPRQIAWMIRLPPFVGFLLPIMSMAVMSVAVVVEWGGPEWSIHLLGLGLSIVLIPVIYVLSRWVRQTCRREFRRRVALLNLCYDCGYDLRVAEGAECGMALEAAADQAGPW